MLYWEKFYYSLNGQVRVTYFKSFNLHEYHMYNSACVTYATVCKITRSGGRYQLRDEVNAFIIFKYSVELLRLTYAYKYLERCWKKWPWLSSNTNDVTLFKHQVNIWLLARKVRMLAQNYLIQNAAVSYVKSRSI